VEHKFFVAPNLDTISRVSDCATHNLTALNHFNIFNHWIMHQIFIIANYLYRYIDKGILELFGPLGSRKLLNYSGFIIELLSTGYIPHYVFFKISSSIVLVILIVAPLLFALPLCDFMLFALF
jgi:hypothetical protein